MDLRVKHSVEVRLEARRLFDSGHGYKFVARVLGLSPTTVRVWHDRHRNTGLLGLIPMSTNRNYPSELKLAAVEEFLAGATSAEVMSKYSISNRSILNKWVAVYRAEGADGLVAKKRGRPVKANLPETPEQELARLRMENAVLKKLAALAESGDPRLWEKPTSSTR